MRQAKAPPPLQNAPDVQLDSKNRPSQARSQDTYEMVLATAGEMLTHVGFEKLTTNRICEKAGLTPPALYRYFPNKYAILKTLGERLMAAQDAHIFDWIEEGGFEKGTVRERAGKIMEIQRKTIEVTRKFPGGVAINRAVRGVPLLQHLHFESRERVAQRLLLSLKAFHPKLPDARLRIGARLIAEMSSAVTQMVVEDPAEDGDVLTAEACYMFALYFDSLRFEQTDKPA